ncbi:MAG: hypothetical protein ACREQI_11515 [Candidatus Binataceae bacterium]
MKIIYDYQGRPVRLTEERLVHILDHPEMAGMASAIEETVAHPERVVQSRSDDAARLYYRFYPTTRAGGKFVCVVVKAGPADSFLLTAYLTDKIKKGKPLWNAST